MLEREIQEIEDKLRKLYDSNGLTSNEINELLDKLEELYGIRYKGLRLVE